MLVNRIVTMVLKNLFAVPSAWFKLCRYAKHPERYTREEMYRHIQYIMRLAVSGGNVELMCTGKENIPQEGGFMFYANHQGMFDVLAVAATCDRPLGAVMKSELSNVPFVRQVASCTGSYAMKQDDPREGLRVIQQVTAQVQSGVPYLLFPEGSRSYRNLPLLEFHGGSFRCATKSKCPIVPIALLDCGRVLDGKGSKPLTVEIHYLKPIEYAEYGQMKPAQVAEMVKGRIEAKIQERLMARGEPKELPERF